MNVTLGNGVQSPSAEASFQATPKALKAKPAPGGDMPKGSSTARKVAAAVLEVLGGVRKPAEAAAALSMSVPKYYLVENRAIQGLVAACEPRPLGRVVTPAGELDKLRKEHERLQRDYARQQALLRAAQRTVGLAPPPAPAKRTGGQKRNHRPTARALTVAARLRENSAVPAEPAAGGNGSGTGNQP